ncbi:snaclec alboaggregin-A subunit alpha-like [Patiria miniata]|uniref:C-type lectin domain-containing protein n=1 Tax=Patiria miniata TaxID=46514 RepID=A0A914BMM5_PATMI|nr:snaclec alboaggregin-A subunit alpha-like [Patiria miniata]
MCNHNMRNRIHLLFLLSVRIGVVTALCNICPFQWTPFGTNCYRLYKEGLSYDMAEQNCLDLSTYRKEAHLVSINSQEELDFITQLVSNVYRGQWKEIWIGMRLDSTAQTATWEDGSDPTAFSYWYGSTTTPVRYGYGDCTLYTISTDKWHPWWNCNANVPSVCKIDQD